MIQAAAAVFISLALMVPFLGWGFYVLRVRTVRDEELPTTIEAVTIGGLIVFYAFQFALFEALLGDRLPLLFGACLVIVGAGGALYGSTIASMISRLLVGVFLPTAGAPVRTPHLGAGERLERLDDLEGALHEYESVARVFPDHPDVSLRMGALLARLGRHNEAVGCLARAIAANRDPEEAFPLVVRMVEILDIDLGDRKQATGTLEEFVRRFHGSSEAGRAQARLERLIAAPPPRARQVPSVPEADDDSLPGQLLPRA